MLGRRVGRERGERQKVRTPVERERETRHKQERLGKERCWRRWCRARWGRSGREGVEWWRLEAVAPSTSSWDGLLRLLLSMGAMAVYCNSEILNRLMETNVKIQFEAAHWRVPSTSLKLGDKLH